MSYESALVAAGCEIIDFVQFGSYQGDWYAYVEFDGEKGIVSGGYGSCSYCDAFEGELGYDSDEPNYQQRLKEFGETYLPTLPVSHYIDQVQKRVNDGYDWGDEKEVLDWLKSLK